MKSTCIEAARDIRHRSNCSTKVGAVLERGGRILAVAYNSMGSRKLGNYIYSRHAESNLLNNIDASGSTVYVYREHAQTKQPLLARPCSKCYTRLVEAGVRTIFYTTSTGWEKERVL